MPIFEKLASFTGARPLRHRPQMITLSRHCIELVDGIAFFALPLFMTEVFLAYPLFPGSLVVR